MAGQGNGTDDEYREFHHEGDDTMFRGGSAEKAKEPGSSGQHFESGQDSAFERSDEDIYDHSKREKKLEPPPDDFEGDAKYERRVKKLDKKIAKVDRAVEKADFDEELEKARYKEAVVKEKKTLLMKRTYSTKLKKGQLDEHGYYENNRTFNERKKRLQGMGIDPKNGRFESTERYREKGKLQGKDPYVRVRLHYEGYRKATAKDLVSDVGKKKGKAFRKTEKRRLLFYKAREAIDDDSLREDEDGAALRKGMGKTYRRTKLLMANTAQNVRLISNPYDRERMLETQERLLHDRRTQLEYKKNLEKHKAQIRNEQNAEMKKRRKKMMVQYKHQEQGNIIQRGKQTFGVAKKKTELKLQRVKSVARVIGVIGGIIAIAAIFIIIAMLVIMALTDGGSQVLINTVSMNDYDTMSSVTKYYNDLCSELDSKYKDDEKREEFEQELRDEFDDDIYEFVYELDAVTYDQFKLLSYLSAKYGTFTLDMVEGELLSIFEEMFTEWHEYKQEYRDVFNDETGEWEEKLVWICYVYLEAKSTAEVVEGRMDAVELNAYTGYNLSSLGQQTMSPVLKEDWTNKISSPFGSRFHPIHKEIRMHNGVDIAVPTGTQVYSPVSGTVILAQYSDSAGYWVKIQDSNGYVISFMHLSSYAVSAGQQVRAGQFIALTGNTGSSTGPHLHLGVQNPDGEYVNPVLMIPQTYAETKTASNTEEDR